MENYQLIRNTDDFASGDLIVDIKFKNHSIKQERHTGICRRIIAKSFPHSWSDGEKVEALVFSDANQPFIRPEIAGHHGSREKLRQDILALARLPHDWAGVESVVPDEKVINDFQYVLAGLPVNLNRPSIEIDEEGGVSLEWVRDRDQARFELYCVGTGRVVGTYVTLDIADQISWRLRVLEGRDLARKLSEPKIFDLMTGAL